MNEVLTRAEMEAQFEGEWVLVADPEVDEYQEVQQGRVVYHGQDREAMYDQDEALQLKSAAYLYFGPPTNQHIWLNGPNMNFTLNTDRLSRQIEFILEIDKLKSILRRSYLVHDPRRENSAEHSWHLAVLAMLLAEHANAEVNLLRVLKMLLVHDIVEIDAGDTFCYDTVGNETKAERETLAAQRIFGLLPDDQREELHELWGEFEARQTPEAKYAAALDRLMPLLHNYHTQGRSWREHGVTRAQVLERNRHIEEGSEAIWQYIEVLIEDADRKGYLTQDSI